MDTSVPRRSLRKRMAENECLDTRHCVGSPSPTKRSRQTRAQKDEVTIVASLTSTQTSTTDFDLHGEQGGGNPGDLKLRRSPRSQKGQAEMNSLTATLEKSSQSNRKRTSSSRKRSIPRKRTSLAKRSSSNYAPPEKYIHLNPITDRMGMELDGECAFERTSLSLGCISFETVVFCGINPGQTSGANGLHFSGPGNRFWPALSSSKLIQGQKVTFTDGPDLPRRFNLGLTDLVSRPTASGKELSTEEKKAAVPSFLQKISQYRPRIVCFMGLGTPSTIFRDVVCSTAKVSAPENESRKKGSKKSKGSAVSKVVPGCMDLKLVHRGVTDPNAVRETIFWALPSTSGAVGQYQHPDHVRLMNEVHDYLTKLKSSAGNTEEMFTLPSMSDSGISVDATI
ncbi:uracil DNA N-glycosylase Thp1 [Stygiomarasmius scandens]|uniref:Uracil DNA N-glycosylase Thp1 n=1 Tax=Marasmiellus scandens TaxID=2682957 RepID=A0ABR1IW20_9AGAR